jgi:NAD-dependent DNA ligase
MLKLKDNKAQKLMEQKTIVLNGIEINLWQGHSRDSVLVQESWNKIQSYTELNKNATGVNGQIVFTGIMQIPRDEASQYAIDLGFKVNSSVSSKTDFVIIGSSNVSPCKISKALELQKKGIQIEFVDEISFLELIIQNEDILNHKKVVRTEKQEVFESIIISESLKGLKIVATGKLENFSRDEIKETIEAHGGKAVSSVSAKTDLLLAGENAGGSKLNKAQELGIRIVNEAEFIEMIK